jgi:hypothetical protein
MTTHVSDPEIEAVVGPARLAYFTPNSEFPILADRKAAFLLTASGLILTVLFFLLDPIMSIVRGPERTLAGVTALLLVAVAGFVVNGARLAYKAFILPIPEMPECLAFFRHIAQNPFEWYDQQIKSLTHPQALRMILHYNHHAARQAAGKFSLVDRSLKSIRLAILLWMLLLMIVSLTA